MYILSLWSLPPLPPSSPSRSPQSARLHSLCYIWTISQLHLPCNDRMLCSKLTQGPRLPPFVTQGLAQPPAHAGSSMSICGTTSTQGKALKPRPLVHWPSTLLPQTMLGNHETTLVRNQNGSGGKMQASGQHPHSTR